MNSADSVVDTNGDDGYTHCGDGTCCRLNIVVTDCSVYLDAIFHLARTCIDADYRLHLLIRQGVFSRPFLEVSDLVFLQIREVFRSYQTGIYLLLEVVKIGFFDVVRPNFLNQFWCEYAVHVDEHIRLQNFINSVTKIKL